MPCRTRQVPGHAEEVGVLPRFCKSALDASRSSCCGGRWASAGSRRRAHRRCTITLLTRVPPRCRRLRCLLLTRLPTSPSPASSLVPVSTSDGIDPPIPPPRGPSTSYPTLLPHAGNKRVNAVGANGFQCSAVNKARCTEVAMPIPLQPVQGLSGIETIRNKVGMVTHPPNRLCSRFSCRFLNGHVLDPAAECTTART